MFNGVIEWLRRYVSPVFVAMLVASFILWYIAKLNYTYTTAQTIRVDVDGRSFEVECVMEGIGTNLFGRMAYMSKSIRIPLSDLKYKPSKEPGCEGCITIDPQSLQNAISVHYSDVKIVSIGSIPDIPNPEKQ